MENEQSVPSFDDLVFTGRNKAYGAYELRARYKEFLSKATVIAGSFFWVAFMIPAIVNYIQSLNPPEKPKFKVIQYTELAEPPSIDKNKPLPPPDIELPKLTKTVKFLPPEVKPDEQVIDEPPPTVEQMKEAPPATETIETENLDVQTNDLVEDENQVYVAVEEMPEFPGGNGELMSFIRKTVNYPEIAKKAGVEGVVVVRFTVDREGKVKDITVLKGIGAGCDEEAARVVSLMKGWSAGKQNGKAVSVQVSVPIRFKLRQ